MNAYNLKVSKDQRRQYLDQRYNSPAAVLEYLRTLNPEKYGDRWLADIKYYKTLNSDAQPEFILQTPRVAAEFSVEELELLGVDVLNRTAERQLAVARNESLSSPDAPSNVVIDCGRFLYQLGVRARVFDSIEFTLSILFIVIPNFARLDEATARSILQAFGIRADTAQWLVYASLLVQESVSNPILDVEEMLFHDALYYRRLSRVQFQLALGIRITSFLRFMQTDDPVVNDYIRSLVIYYNQISSNS